MILFLYTGVNFFLNKKNVKNQNILFHTMEKRKELGLYCTQCNI